MQGEERERTAGGEPTESCHIGVGSFLEDDRSWSQDTAGLGGKGGEQLMGTAGEGPGV